MKKILALDLGDQWVGSALSDILQMFAHPYKTVGAKETEKFLTEILNKEPISHVVVGHPTTMKGTKSEQTQRVEVLFEKFKTLFPDTEWVLWDERLSSQRASQGHKRETKEDKLFSHSRAAAFILDSYLNFLRIQKNF